MTTLCTPSLPVQNASFCWPVFKTKNCVCNDKETTTMVSYTDAREGKNT